MEKIKVLGIPFDFGQDLSGVREASRYLVTNGLLDLLDKVAPVEYLGEMKFPEKGESGTGIKWSKEASVANHEISLAIEDINLRNSFLLNIGGDHGMALGTIHGVLAHNPDSVIVWADAHGDINTPQTSPSGNFHGMPLSFLLKAAQSDDFNWLQRFIRPHKLILIGPRDLDNGEKEIISKLKIQYYSSEDLNRDGAKEILDIALHRADPLGTAPVHLSFDVDIFDQVDIRSTGTRVPHGPKLEEVFLLGGLLAETGRLRSMDLVEFNPEIGNMNDVKKSADLISEFLQTTLKQVFLSRSFLFKAFNINQFRQNFI